MTLMLLASGACHLYGQAVRPAASEQFVLDHNRIFVELAFVRADGTRRKVLAFVDSGDPTFTLSIPLVKELQVEKWKGNSDIHVLFGGKPRFAAPAIKIGGQASARCSPE